MRPGPSWNVTRTSRLLPSACSPRMSRAEDLQRLDGVLLRQAGQGLMQSAAEGLEILHGGRIVHFLPVDQGHRIEPRKTRAEVDLAEEVRGLGWVEALKGRCLESPGVYARACFSPATPSSAKTPWHRASGGCVRRGRPASRLPPPASWPGPCGRGFRPGPRRCS